MQLSLDPFTGQVLRGRGYAGYTPARKVRSWLRFLHTGEALGWPGQLAAALASLGGDGAGVDRLQPGPAPISALAANQGSRKLRF